MAGLLVAVALCLTAIPGNLGRWVLVVPYVLSIAAARHWRSRGLWITGIVLGVLIVAVHVLSCGSDPAVRRTLLRASATLDSLHLNVRTLVHDSRAEGMLPTGEELDAVVAAFDGSGVLLDDGERAVWSGTIAGPRIPPGAWAIARRGGAFLAATSRDGQTTMTVRVPLTLDARQDTAVSLAAGPAPAGVFAPPLPTSAAGWVHATLALVVVMEVLRCRERGRTLLALAIIAAGRIGLAMGSFRGPLFDSDVFATHLPLLDSPGDLAATTASFLLMASLVRGRAAGTILYRGIAVIAGSAGAASVMAWAWRTALPFCTLHVERLELIATTPAVWALVASAAFLFCALALLAASASLWLAGGMAVAGTALAVKEPGGWVSFLPFFFLAVVVLRHRRLWAVTQATAVVIVAAAAILPRGERFMAQTHRMEVERLASRLASEQRQWFHFLARDVANSWHEAESLYEIWLRSPLRRLPTTGQLMEVSGGVSLDRLAFGLRHQPSVPAGADTGVVVWEEVTEEMPPPRSVVNAATQRGDRTVVVSLVQDLLASASGGGADYLADGTPWPSIVRCADRGLLSLQDPDGPEMGWRRDEGDGGLVFRFQREYADGPHVVDLALVQPAMASRGASFLALAGLLCLMADLVVALDRCWRSTSWHALFYHYRDRLLPLLLIVGTGPVLSLVVIGPALERAATERDRWLETRAKSRDVASSFRVELLRQAGELALHVGALQGTPPSGDPVRRLEVLDPAVMPRTVSAEEDVPIGLIRVVAERGRNLLWVAGSPPLVHALVPHARGALLLATPVDAALAAALGGTHDWSAAVWRYGRMVTAVLSPHSGPVPSLLPRSAVRALASTVEVSVQAGRWAFAFIPDDLVGESLVLGVRLDRPGRDSSGSAVFKLWALAVFLPVVTLTVLVSSLAARLVTTPISRLTALAGRVGGSRPEPHWPRLSGELGELSSALDEMTARLAASVAAAAREKARLETILEHIDAGVVVADSRLRVERTNSAARGLGQLIGELGESLVGGPLEGLARRVVETGVPARETRQSSERRMWQVSAAPLRGYDGSLHGAVIVLEETTEVAARQRLLTWADFAREAAHEIKNPLTPIKLSAQHLRRAFDDGSPDFPQILAHATEMIERQTARMEAILRDLSSFSKATGRPFVPVDIVPLVAQVVRDYSYYESRGVVVRMTDGEVSLRVAGDADALRTVYANIIDNAVKAIGRGGEVVVSVMRSGDTVVFRCDDTGPGIPVDMMERVFAPGFSLRPGGTGLGLSICRSLVSAHGGSIHIVNLEPGTRVDVLLPRHAPEG